MQIIKSGLYPVYMVMTFQIQLMMEGIGAGFEVYWNVLSAEIGSASCLEFYTKQGKNLKSAGKGDLMSDAANPFFANVNQALNSIYKESRDKSKQFLWKYYFM